MEDLRKKLENRFEDCSVSISKETKSCRPSSNHLNQLYEVGELQTHDWQRYTIKVRNKICVAKLLFSVFPDDSVSYINWIRIHDKRQGEGLSYFLWEKLIQKLGDVSNKIFSKIVNTNLQQVASKNGFSPVNYEGGNWYVRT